MKIDNPLPPMLTLTYCRTSLQGQAAQSILRHQWPKKEQRIGIFHAIVGMGASRLCNRLGMSVSYRSP